jgi:hypothetical protein
MLNNVVLQLLLALNVNAPLPLDLHDATSTTAWNCAAALLAASPSSKREAPGPYHGDDPYGDDPHGDDPHDQVHDGELPANKHRKDGYRSNDPYDG